MEDPEYNKMLKTTGSISRNAIVALRNLKLPNIPECYHVAYDLYENNSQNIEAQLKVNNINPSDILNNVRGIYRKNIKHPQEKELTKFANRFHQLAKDTSTKVGEGRDQLKNYANYLKDVKPFLEPDSNSNILNVITLLIKETESVHLFANDLEQNLKEAQLEIEELRNEQIIMKELSKIDTLTGLLNRTGLDETFESSMLIEDNYPMSVLFVDIDHFKKFNDNYGHLVGDKVLTIISKVLRKNIKGIDLIARIGGEELIIILMKTKEIDAVSVADKLRQSVENVRIKNRKSKENIEKSTISIGVSSLMQDGNLIESIDRADKAMYKAKENGRNCVVSFSDMELLSNNKK